MLSATVANLIIRLGLLMQIWLCATGHYSEFGYVLWVTAADLVICYGPLRGMKPYSKNL